ncbi:MAG TPA: translocation/assembly module TamB domain-containing protein, partial [Reyranella sp.]|nr:translocation/assembly module TamB domain-containing protein [Reyranella sp.]
LRAPLPSKSKPASRGGSFTLPVGVDLQALSVDTLHLAASLAGEDSRWTLHGNGLLSADLHEGRLRLTGDRTDGPSGKLSADTRFDLAQRTVDGEIAVEEGPGGVTAALLQRPDLAGVSMRLVAKGDAATGNGELTVSAGDAVTAKGTAQWRPDGAGTAVSVHLDASGKELPDAGPVSLTAEATVDNKMATLSSSTLTAGPLNLAATARYDRVADRLDATATARSDAPGALAPRLGGVNWRGLTLSAHALLGNLAKQPEGTVELDGSADDLTVAALDGRLPGFGRTTLAAKLGVQRDGSLTLEALNATTAVASVIDGVGSYQPKTETGEVKTTVELPSLTPFSALAERQLVGRARLELTARRDDRGLAVGWQGTLFDVGAPDVPPDLVAHEVRLAGKAALRNDQTWSLADIKVASGAGTFGLSGSGKGETGKFDLSVELPQLSVLRPGIAGATTASSTIELRPDGSAGGSLTANGTVSGQPLSIAGRFDRDAAGGITVPSFEGHWASAVLNVTDLAITRDRTSGSARLKVARLQDVAAVAGTDLAGAIDAEVTTDPQLAAGRLQVRLGGTGIRSGGIGIGTLQLDATIDDPSGAAATDAKLTASGITGAADIGRLSGTAKGDRQRGFEVTLQASGAATAATLAAKVELLGEEIRIALSRFEGRHLGIPVALNAPTRLNIAGPRIRIDPTTLRLGGGRLAVQGVLDPAATDLRLDLSALPLSLVDTFAPGTGLDGSLQAQVRVAGPMANPRIDATYTASSVRLRRPEAALLPALGVQGSASLNGRQASIDARLSAGTGSSLSLKGKGTTAPLAGTGTLTGSINIAPFAPLLGNQVRNIAGTLRSDLALDINGNKITGTGSLDLSNGALAFPEMGMRLSDGTARVVLQGDALQLQQLTFQTGRNGTLTANGSLRLDEQQGIAVDLAVASRRALLVNRADLVATVSSDLKVTGSTVGGIDIAGPVTIDRAEISVGGAQSAAFPTVDVREINKPGAAPPPPPSPTARPAPPPSATPIRLALDVQAPQAVFVRGRGLDAEMSGSLKVTGAPTAPVVLGGLTVRRGDFTLAGRRLVFSRGIVSLNNVDRIDPALDFIATSSVNSTTINVVITGTAAAPAIAITSVPALPQDEALALLLFGKPASGLSAFELIQVAQSLAELTGREAPGTSMLGRLRQSLGLDQLRVGSGSSGSSPVSIEAGRYVAPGVYVGAKQGASGNSSRGVVEIEVLDHTKVEGDIGADSRGRLGVKMEWDY